MKNSPLRRKTETKRQRFRHLIWYFLWLEQTDPDSFDISNWMQADNNSAIRKAVAEWPHRYRKGEALDCGTAACVYGHFPVIWPDIFRHRHISGPRAFVQGDLSIFDKPSCEDSCAAQWLGGKETCWDDIFNPTTYRAYPVEIKHVLRRLRKLYKELYGENCPRAPILPAPPKAPYLDSTD